MGRFGGFSCFFFYEVYNFLLFFTFLLKLFLSLQIDHILYERLEKEKRERKKKRERERERERERGGGGGIG